jgi:hypothetical protein
MLWGNFPGSIDELPRRIGKNSCESLPGSRPPQIRYGVDLHSLIDRLSSLFAIVPQTIPVATRNLREEARVAA